MIDKNLINQDVIRTLLKIIKNLIISIIIITIIFIKFIVYKDNHYKTTINKIINKQQNF